MYRLAFATCILLSLLLILLFKAESSMHSSALQQRRLRVSGN